MRIAVIGSGAREHALTWALRKGGDHEVWTLPGNAGSLQSEAISVDDFSNIEVFCKNHDIQLLVVGPEHALALGINNVLTKSGLCVFGPTREAARLESSKIWSKQFMSRHLVRTAPFVATQSLQEAESAVEKWKGDCVIKWDGLAAGKGVAVCHSIEDAQKALAEYHSKFSSLEFVIEERLVGRELSVFIVTNGDQYVLLPPAKDYKRAYDGDKGPNTGGMGAVSCDSLWDDELKIKIEETIIKPTLRGLKKENIPYMGFLYFGLMICDGDPYLLEYNVRLGDPETSVVLPRLETPLFDCITGALEWSLDKVKMRIKEDACVTVVMASEGYPSAYKTGYKIEGLDVSTKDTFVFHAGTRKGERSCVSSGGRILNCTALGSSLQEARAKAYAVCDQIHIPSSFYRRDIGEDCLHE